MKDIRSFVGLARYYRRHVPDFARLAQPLTNLTKKDVPFEWTSDQQRGFDELKRILSTEPLLIYPDFSQPFIVACDASTKAEIPLKAVDRYFDLYQVHSLPFFHRGIGKFVMIDEPFSYLAVAESRQLFALVTPYMLTKCTQEVYTVCPSDMMLKTAVEPDCLIALFLGKMDTELSKCKRLIINGTYEPVWIRSPDASYWIYSLNAPQRVTVQCQETGSPLSSATSSQMLLEGTGILSNSSSCYV